jgi:hypothetical protein
MSDDTKKVNVKIERVFDYFLVFKKKEIRAL